MESKKSNGYLIESYQDYFVWLTQEIRRSALVDLQGSTQTFLGAVELIQNAPRDEHAVFFLEDVGDNTGTLLNLIRELGKDAGWIVISTSLLMVPGSDYDLGKNFSIETVDEIIKGLRS